MKLINRHKSCWGISLFRWKQFTIEMWFCPPYFVVEPHSHPNENIELQVIYGDALFLRQEVDWFALPVESKKVFGFNRKKFTVPAGWKHWFEVSSKWLIFINYAKWLDGIKPTSAANDFKELKTEKEINIYARQ